MRFFVLNDAVVNCYHWSDHRVHCSNEADKKYPKNSDEWEDYVDEVNESSFDDYNKPFRIYSGDMYETPNVEFEDLGDHVWITIDGKNIEIPYEHLYWEGGYKRLVDSQFAVKGFRVESSRIVELHSGVKIKTVINCCSSTCQGGAYLYVFKDMEWKEIHRVSYDNMKLMDVKGKLSEHSFEDDFRSLIRMANYLLVDLFEDLGIEEHHYLPPNKDVYFCQENQSI